MNIQVNFFFSHDECYKLYLKNKKGEKECLQNNQENRYLLI